MHWTIRRQPWRSVWLVVFALSACTSIPPQAQRLSTADALAAQHGWQRVSLSTRLGPMVAYLPRLGTPGGWAAGATQTHVVTIYIEGDGLAWLNAETPSDDPTPLNPLALRLALAQPGGQAAYLARPCQFLMQAPEQMPFCARQQAWTSHRFSAEVIAASHEALDQIKARMGAEHIILVGYSGGGAVAALLAAERHDVLRLITVAGNLDHAAWTTLHRISPLSGSLNPADRTDPLEGLPQVHWVGAEDDNVPASVAQGFAQRFRASPRPAVRVVPQATHDSGWVRQWAHLYMQSGSQMHNADELNIGN